MADSERQDTSQKLKIAAIPVLAIVLLYFTLRASSKDRKPPTPGPTHVASTTQPSSAVVVAPVALADGDGVDAPKKWPNQPLTEILKHNPFTEFVKVPQSASKQLASKPDRRKEATNQLLPELLERFSEQPPALLLRSRHGTTAVFDAQTVREGDVLEGGARVVEIRPDGIVFELVDPD